MSLPGRPEGERASRHEIFVEATGSGPPLVLLHGFALHGGLFAPIVAGLGRSHRVHVVDLPGHGYSTARAAPGGAESAAENATAGVGARTLIAMVDAVAAFIARCGPPVHVLGWSLGGIVAQRLALDHPHLVRRLVLVCTTPRFVTAPDWPHAMAAATLARFGEELRTDARATLLRFLTLQVQGRGETGVVGRGGLAALRASLLARPTPSPASLDAALEVLASTDLRADVAHIAAPTLVVTGPRDALTPAAAGEWLAGRIPHARHVAIAGAAHAPFLSHPAAFVTAVHDFLDDVHAAVLQRA